MIDVPIFECDIYLYLIHFLINLHIPQSVIIMKINILNTNMIYFLGKQKE